MVANEKWRRGRCWWRALFFAAGGAMLGVVVIRRDTKHIIALDADAMQGRRAARCGLLRRVLGRLRGWRIRAHAAILAQSRQPGIGSGAGGEPPSFTNSVLAASSQSGIASVEATRSARAGQIPLAEVGAPRGEAGSAARRGICYNFALALGRKYCAPRRPVKQCTPRRCWKQLVPRKPG